MAEDERLKINREPHELSLCIINDAAMSTAAKIAQTIRDPGLQLTTYANIVRGAAELQRRKHGSYFPIADQLAVIVEIHEYYTRELHDDESATD